MITQHNKYKIKILRTRFSYFTFHVYFYIPLYIGTTQMSLH